MRNKEQAKDEIKKGQAEQTATIAAQSTRRSTTVTRKPLRFSIIFGVVALLLVVVTASATWAIVNSKGTFQQDTTVFVEKVQDLATLATAQAHVKVVIKEQDNKLFGKNIPLNLVGTKRELLLIVPATVVAGVDLKNIMERDMIIDQEQMTMDIMLPRASFLQEPAIEMEKVETFSDEGLFRSEANWDEGYDLAAQAQEDIKEEAKAMGLLQTAEENAEKVLKGVFTELGYTVTITFK